MSVVAHLIVGALLHTWLAFSAALRFCRLYRWAMIVDLWYDKLMWPHVQRHYRNTMRGGLRP